MAIGRTNAGAAGARFMQAAISGSLTSDTGAGNSTSLTLTCEFDPLVIFAYDGGSKTAFRWRADAEQAFGALTQAVAVTVSGRSVTCTFWNNSGYTRTVSINAFGISG